MAPYFPNFFDEDSEEILDESEQKYETSDAASLSHMAFWYMMVLIAMLLTWLLLFFCLRIFAFRQKTRNQQPRRGAVFNGSRSRPSLSSHEPTIYVSPSNLPPPPKYECLAPPSYEEVVGIHYPNYQAQQPIAQPIATALAQSTQPSTTAQDSGSDTRNNDTVVVTVNERPTVTNT